ncbi:MAG: hypothetical protein Q9170_004487 [Blastenia crenularia]
MFSSDPWALDKGYQVLFLDQRGTGSNSALTAQTLASQGGPGEQVEYLRHFRADSIEDCEAIRKLLTADYPEEKKKCTASMHHLRLIMAIKAFTCADLAPLFSQPDSVYHNLYNEAQLAANKVPVYASAYVDDMYVSFDLAMETARKIRGCKLFVTNTMYHHAISHAGRSDELFKELFKLRDDCLD